MSREVSTNSQIKFKTTMLKSSLCDCNDAFILVNRTLIAVKQEADGTPIAADRNERQIIFKNYDVF